jgi:hypothetical protein
MKNQNHSSLKYKSLFLCGLALFFIQTGCVPFAKIRKSLENPAAERPTRKKELADEFNLKSASDVAQQEIYKLLLAKDFDSIEKIANDAREKKERLSGGYWKLDSLYEALTTIYSEYPGQEETDEMWKNRIELLKQWKENSPKSITARIALAKSYIAYGGFARGGGYIDTVSREGYRLLHERLDLAEKELAEAEELGIRCPRWYREMLYIGMFKGWSTDDFEQLYEEAINFEPGYLQFHLVKSEYLTPKWSGSQREWQKFVDELPGKLATLKTDETDIIYFVVVVNKMNDPSLNLNFAMFAKERIKQGFADLDKKYKTDNFRLNQFASISCMSGEYYAAQEAFDRIGNDWNKEVWSEKTFTAMKQLTFQAVNPAQKK